MPVFDLFSKRQARLEGDLPDVYVYDDIPQKLRVQIVHILNDTLGSESDFINYERVKEAYQFVERALCREYGVFDLSPPKTHFDRDTAVGHIHRFILYEQGARRVLDATEMCFKSLEIVGKEFHYRRRQEAKAEVDEAIEELNHRFQENAVGYRYEQKRIVRIDSELIHAEIVKPALKLLQAPMFKGAQDEFLEAHRNYRNGSTKDALNECLKALESTMKAIAAKRGWTHEPGATATTLVDLMISNQLVPTYWTSHFSGLRTMLVAGVPTVRNKRGGHGQGETIVEVPDHVAAFAVHQTASAIVFLAQADGTLPT